MHIPCNIFHIRLKWQFWRKKIHLFHGAMSKWSLFVAADVDDLPIERGIDICPKDSLMMERFGPLVAHVATTEAKAVFAEDETYL